VGDQRNLGMTVGLAVVILIAIGSIFFFVRRPSSTRNQTLPGNFVRPAKPPGIAGPG
jgi:hypothetical protein